MAFIEFDSNKHARLAFKQLNNKKLKGLTVNVGFRDAHKHQSKQLRKMVKKATKLSNLKQSGISAKTQKQNGRKKNAKVSNVVKGHKNKARNIEKKLKFSRDKKGKQKTKNLKKKHKNKK